jgi:two-component system response regulator HydG
MNPSTNEPTSAPRVLVVDDRHEMAETIVDNLCDRGYVALGVDSGRDALRMLRTERIDVLITDLRMPEMDGFDLLRASRALDPSRPVIVMTAYGTFDGAIEATRLGAYHYLTKPFRLEALLCVLEEALPPR